MLCFASLLLPVPLARRDRGSYTGMCPIRVLYSIPFAQLSLFISSDYVIFRSSLPRPSGRRNLPQLTRTTPIVKPLLSAHLEFHIATRPRIYSASWSPLPQRFNPRTRDSMASLVHIIAGALCLLLLPRLVSYYRSRRRGRRLPGPSGLPVVGNVRDIPAPHEYPWLKYHDWCREYSECSAKHAGREFGLMLSHRFRHHRPQRARVQHRPAGHARGCERASRQAIHAVLRQVGP